MRARMLPLVLCLGLLCACGQEGERVVLSLYLLSQEDYGPALVTERWTGAEMPEAGELLTALLEAPSLEGSRSPFPQDLTLRDYHLEDGVLYVDFSEQYGGLADVSLTLADYCVTLTLCQLEEVEAVEITVSGRPLPYRSHQRLYEQEALLWLEQEEAGLP